jgi:hypothetical protein
VNANDDDSIAALVAEIQRDYARTRGDIDGIEKIKEHCRGFFEGKVFVSHTADDAAFCEPNILPPLKKFGLWSHFYMNRTLPAHLVSAYRFMVEYTMYYAKTVVIVVSKHSVGSAWVQLEVRWAIERPHAFIVCLVDGTSPAQLHPKLVHERRFGLFGSLVRLIDFQKDSASARARFNSLIQTPRFAPEMNRRNR